MELVWVGVDALGLLGCDGLDAVLEVQAGVLLLGAVVLKAATLAIDLGRLRRCLLRLLGLRRACAASASQAGGGNQQATWVPPFCVQSWRAAAAAMLAACLLLGLLLRHAVGLLALLELAACGTAGRCTQCFAWRIA